MYSRRSFLEVHEYDATFKGRNAHFKMTSVIGHVLSIDFPAKFQNWDTTDPSTLFDAPTLKNESNPKVNLYFIAQKALAMSLSLAQTCYALDWPTWQQLEHGLFCRPMSASTCSQKQRDVTSWCCG